MADYDIHEEVTKKNNPEFSDEETDNDHGVIEDMATEAAMSVTKNLEIC